MHNTYICKESMNVCIFVNDEQNFPKKKHCGFLFGQQCLCILRMHVLIYDKEIILNQS